MAELRRTISARTQASSTRVLDLTTSEVAGSKTLVRTIGGRAIVVPAGSDSRRLLAEIAREQRGHISYAQLLAIGFTNAQVRTLHGHATLHRVHHGVYRVGHTAPVPLGAETAAVLWFGGRAVLSHLTALRLHGLIAPDEGAPIDVTVAAGGSAYQRTGIQVHSSRTLTKRQIKPVAGLPMTVAERALLDSAPLLTKVQLGRAFDEAIARRVTSHTKVAELVMRLGGHPGQGKLAELVGQRRFPTVTESEAEDRFLALIADAGLPAPRTQVPVHGFRIDAYWPQARFAVEIDGFQWHARTTWDQITEEPLRLVAHIAQRLALRTAAATL
jgi:hypothetical protein